MSEAQKPQPEFPEVPYKKFGRYLESIRGEDLALKVVSVWSGRQKVKVGEDLKNIDPTSGLKIILRNSVLEDRLVIMQDEIMTHLNLAATGLPSGEENSLFYFSNKYLISYFKEDYPDIDIKENNPPLNRVYVISLMRESGKEKQEELSFFFKPEAVENNDGRNVFNYLNFEFVDKNPELVQFVAGLALFGFPIPRYIQVDEE